MRGTPVPTTTVGNRTIVELSNGDFILFNIGATDYLFTVNFSNVSGILTQDIWDYTNKILYSNTNGTDRLNASAYSASLHFVETFDHIEPSWAIYKA